jgi:ATP-binding cassette subfamily B protein
MNQQNTELVKIPKQVDLNRIVRELNQPCELPLELQLLIEKEWQGAKILFMALIDFDNDLQLTERWLLMGEKSIALAYRSSECAVSTSESRYIIKSHSRQSIGAVKEQTGLSLNRVTIFSIAAGVTSQTNAAASVLFTLRYSNRQKKAVSHIVFCLEQELKERKVAGGESEKVPSRTMLASSLQMGDASDVSPKPVDSDLPSVMDLERFRDRSAGQLYAEAVLAPLKEAQSLDASGKMGVIWRLLGYLWPYRQRVATGMFAAIMMTLSNLVPPFLTGRLIDDVIKPHELGMLSTGLAMKTARNTIMALAIVYLLREFFAWVRLRWMSTVGEAVASDLRSTVYTHIHRLSMSYFSSKQTGSLISRVSSDTDRIWDFIAFGVVEVTTSIMMLIGLSVVLICLDWRLGLLVTIPIPFVLGAIVLHGQRMQGLFLRAWRKWSALTDCLSDTIPGVRVVKAFNREKFETDKFKARNLDVYGEFVNIHKAWTSFWPGLMLVIQSIVLAVWFFGLPRVLGSATPVLASGQFVSFVLYLTMFVQPIEVIGQMARMVNRATSSAYRVFEVLDTEPQICDDGAAIQLEPLQGAVTFENVYFTYDGVRPILRNLSFSVAPGEMIGLVGPSGSGKTTVTNLLARFYEVGDGRVLIDGVDIRQLDSGHFRRQVGMVLQDPYLFHGSILENIRYAKPESSHAEVIRSAQIANAHKFICQLPHGYDTVVGEKGHTLSGGERQRISIARAILLDPKILILDEATSAVDTETERQIQEALDRLVKGRTVIAIAHRLSTLTRAHRLLVMKEGRLVENGPHEELLKIENGIFAGLYKMQQELHASTVV